MSQNTSIASDPSCDRLFDIPALRTYLQIAAILTEREEDPITPAKVERLCRSAEGKIAKALRAQPPAPSRWGSDL